MGPLDDLWPLYRLRVRTGALELRLPDETDLAALAELTRDPIHDPATMPFSMAWTDQPADDRARSTVQWHWKARGEWSAAEWRLELVATRAGEVVGSQALHGSRFAVTRQVDSGSWVGRRFQGQGVGTAMRRAVLQLAFAGLGAVTARSEAFADNTASLRVSEKLGYLPDGTATMVRRDQPATMVRLLLAREGWEARSPSWPEVVVEGLRPSLSLFGLKGE
jgi:RimJ/RimL family protein N-acetyltransferase